MNRRVQITAHLNPPPAAIIKRPADNESDTVRNFYLEYVYFIPDQPAITYESLHYMQQLARNLKTYTTESFDIVGHINYQSRFDSTHLKDLYRLSQQRAKAVYDYLVEAGIPKTKMTYKGVGNSMPIYPSPVNDEQRRKNMRVQVIIKR